MATGLDSTVSMDTPAGSASGVLQRLYRVVGYVGLMSIFGSQLFGFRYDSNAPEINFLYNALLYGVFVVPHLLMTRLWFKQAVWGNPTGSPAERRVYILVSVVTWLVAYSLSWPLPGGEVTFGTIDGGIKFFAMLAFLWSLLLFFQGVSFAMLDGLLGVRGAAGHYSHGAETPLLTDGPYAEVRHPMYRAATLASLSSLLIHPNLAQLFWVAAIGITFLGFIPVEEAQMIAARGDDYRQYQIRTPYRLFRGLW